MRLVHVLKAAAEGYGPEKRVILLHGPVGSSKCTIARLLKKGIEHYSRTPDGALYTFDWVNLDEHGPRRRRAPTRSTRPMHEEPLRLIPPEWRDEGDRASSGSRTTSSRVQRRRRPRSRRAASSSTSLMTKYEGDWAQGRCRTTCACGASC